ncbi:MFS transporter [Rhodoferax aquaticus]|uniref:MFS transporter n=1 Tax=Rhodoferax aquaticus TaxID=2527691 RepID=A0A515EV47_9BURK|nr:MFS transporter [Rhodoferax aquaticus]QDL56554.1 MFS transporter [Rhodoferax aquaticus]
MQAHATPSIADTPAPQGGVAPASAALRVADGVRYGLLGFPLAFCALPLYVLMPNLYATQWGVSLAALGAVLLAARIFDALLDPLLGRWCDHLYARSLGAVQAMGRWAALLLAVGFCALFTPAVRESDALLWWALGSLLLTYLGYSALTVAHHSWGAMLGGDAVRRSHIVAWREGMGLVGVVLAAVIPGALGLPAMLWVFVVGLALACWAWSYALRPERPAPVADTAAGPADQPLSLWHAWRVPAFVRLMAVYVPNGIASAVPATLVLFFIQDRLQADAAWQSACLALYFVSGAASLPLWMRAVRRWGLVRSWGLGMVLSVLSFAGAGLLGAGDVAWFALVCVLSGTALGSDLALPGALLAGVIGDAGHQGRGEGVYMGWWNFATKLNLALAAGLALPLLGLLGYTPGAREPHALHMLSLAYCVLPLVLKGIAFAALACLLLKREALPHARIASSTPT